MDDSRKGTVNLSDFKPADFSGAGIVLDGDYKKFAEWYLEMTKDLEPLDDIEDD